ncbi:hypothetical protein MNBD_GAMMA20-2162 [hydrothermal vent metagenome]|uniref:Transmembrane protein n=1 Tax=hydrothermal vent metagenome TaxID=652676 RepID=A0A3B1BI86_9ZZZZ
MHPVIKIILFLIYATAIAFGDVMTLLAGAVLMLALYLPGSREQLLLAFRMLRRMRWFFLSIALVYLLFTPGRLLFSAWPWGPTLEGLSGGGLRIISLVLIVFAVNLLLRTTLHPALISAILWCLTPLAWVGLPRERLAVRIALTLDAVDSVQVIYRHRPRDDGHAGEPSGNTRPASLKARLQRIGATAQRLVTAVIEQAEAAPTVAIEVPRPSNPPLIQWLYPLLLGTLFMVLGG